MLIKNHKSYRNVVAVCDSELLGKKLEEGKMQLEIGEHFFGGEEISEPKLIELLKNCSREDVTFNIVGEKSIQAALKAGIISKQGVKKIQAVPFALVLL